MLQPKRVKFEYLQQESYLAFIKNSVGSKMFRTFYVKNGSSKYDVLKNGNLSCAYYASTVLRMFGLIKKLHFTVAKTADDLMKNGAKKIPVSKTKPGDVLIWTSKDFNDGPHNHIGFYIGDEKAISNSEKRKQIIQHHFTFNDQRDIELALRPDWKRVYAKS